MFINGSCLKGMNFKQKRGCLNKAVSKGIKGVNNGKSSDRFIACSAFPFGTAFSNIFRKHY
ncbi:hypothetical protein D7Z54_06715 [Salibacterium salarium]|uniref:Uncharacterized protein n=1 Tax=Salibacterium salarium TaxID=284579 RepID=A0A3R9QMR7_9BACI|nr:hypothetical protein D7Z54_06715 [Salibacterium salarium]